MKVMAIVLVAALSSGLPQTGNNEEVTKDLEKVAQFINKDEFAKAKEILAADFHKYIMPFFERRPDLKDPVGYPNLQSIAMNAALVEFVMGEYQEGYNCVNAAVALRNIGWGRSWYDHFDTFKKETEMTFSGKSKRIRARMYYTISAIDAALEEDEDEMADLKKAYATDPTDFEVTVALARSIRESGDIPGSKEYFLKAIELDPKNAKALSDAAMVLNATGETAKALDLIQRAVQLDPEDQIALIKIFLLM